MNHEDILSGRAGLRGIQRALNGQSSRRLLRDQAQKMLRPGYRAGPFRLTRAKFKPDRKLSAYFTFPAFDGAMGDPSHLVHLAVSWQHNSDSDNRSDTLSRLQSEADQSGLMPVQRELWREIPGQGIRLQMWPFDAGFPNLVRLGDPSHVNAMLASLGIAHDPKEMPVVTAIRYRPGERHVLRYGICPPGVASGERQQFYAKLYPNGEDAARAFGIANRVVDWLASSDCAFSGSRPEAMSREDGAILYRHAPGIPLSLQLDRSGQWLASRLRTIGRALAILHNGPETLQSELRQNDFVSEAKVVRRASEHVQVLLPAAHAKIAGILEKAERYYSGLPQERPTFTHSDFKSDHLLTTPQGVTLIDFDTCALADPALDIGKFLADLEWWFSLKAVEGVEQAQAQLLKGYLEEATPTGGVSERLARARLFQTLILVKITVRRVPIYKSGWAEMTDRMIERAAQVLHSALTA